MQMPYGEVEGSLLNMHFSSADFSVAAVVSAIRQHLDVLEEIGICFLGIATEVHTGPTPVFRPTDIKATFEHCGPGEAQPPLERTYQIIWQGVINTFPEESAWAQAKRDFGEYIRAQADLLRARTENSGARTETSRE